MADPAGDKPPASSANDHWYDAISLLTGYKPSLKRGEIFKSLYGNDDIPLMKVEIDTSGAEPTNAELEAINDMSWRSRNSGWRINDTDFVVPFFGPTNNSDASTLSTGSRVHMRRARITLLGTYNHEIPHGGVSVGGKFGAGSHLMPSGFEGWDSTPLAQYSYGGGLALEKLMYNPYTTQGFSFNNVTVDDNDAVDLKSFDKAALAFNRAALFFHNARATIQQWEDALGNEDAAWRGQAAGVFWDLLHQLGVNYQNYTDSLSVGGLGLSKVALNLESAKSGFQQAIDNLYWTWSDWALKMGNPLRWLYDILFDVTDQIWLNNITKVRWHETYSYSAYSSSSYSWNQVDEDGWSGDAKTADGKNFGPLNSKATWKAIGEEAIKRWQTSVDDHLGKASQEALRNIHNSWAKVPDSIPKLTTTQINLLADLQADKAQAAQDKADKQREEDKKHQQEQEEKADKQRQEDLQHQKEMEEKADKEREEDKKHQQELEEEQKKQRDEDKKHQDELEKKQDQEREEDKKHQDELEKQQQQQYQQQQEEQKKQQDEAKQQYQQQQDEQKKQYEQQQKDQQEQEKKQEELQKKQEEEAKQQNDQQMALQMQMRKEDQQKQDEQEKKQEELQKQQQDEAKKQFQQQQEQQQQQQDEAKQQYAQQQKDQQAQEKKQEELQKQQQDEAKKQYAEQQKQQQEQEKKQEQLQQQQQDEAKKQYAEQQKQQQEQQKQQQEAEKKQEALQKQQQEQAQKQFDQQQKQQQDIAKELVQPGNQKISLPGNQELVQPGSPQLQPSQLTSHVVQNPDGSLSTVFGNDNSGLNSHAGLGNLNSQTGLEHLQPGQIQSHSTLNPDGTITTDFSDGSSTTINPHTGLETTVHPNGTTTHEQLTHGHALTNPDGSQTTVNPDGTVTTHYQDGSYTTVNPKTGTAVTHEPNGETFTTPLGHEGTSLPGSSLPGGSSLQSPLGNGAASYYEPAVHDLAGSGGLLGGPSSAALGGQATSTPTDFPVGQSGGVLPPATRLDGTTTGGLPAGAAAQQGGYPPMMGGMGGMGMGGMGGGGEKNGNGERVRQVYDDEDIIPSDGGSLGRRARRNRAYEESVPGANFTPTSSGYNPYGGEDHRQTESGDRERETWAPEEEDVWGTDEGGAPAVIG